MVAKPEKGWSSELIAEDVIILDGRISVRIKAGRTRVTIEAPDGVRIEKIAAPRRPPTTAGD
jgi:hypothetical protein